MSVLRCGSTRWHMHLRRPVPKGSPGVGPARAAWLAAPVAGACTVALPVFGTDAALEFIVREHPTVVCGTPAQLAMLTAKFDRANTRTVRLWYTSGSVL